MPNEARRWKDKGGTEWFVKRREAARGLKSGWILRRVGYSFVAWDDAAEAGDMRLQSFVDSHTARGADDGTTARLWTDPRNNTEWEVHDDAGELVFQRGIEAFRVERGYGAPPPRSLDDPKLEELLDRAQGKE